MTAFELAGKLKLDSSEFSSSLNKQESSFKSFGNKLGKAAKTIGKVAMAGLATVGAGTVMMLKSSIQEGLDFDAAMSQVAATLGKSTDEVKELSDFARKMGAETAFSATQAAEALNYMALAGYDSEKSMRMLPTVLNLAAAGNMELATASDMVTDAQSALGLSIEETEVLIDQMAKTSSKTNTSVEQLGSAILTVGGTAKGLKGGTTELAAVLGVLADNGIKGSEGGTALRNVLLSLTAPTDQAAKVLQSLGINVFDAEGNMREFPDILQSINEATKDMTQAERTDFLSTVFNKRDLKSIEALLGTDMKRWQELYKEIGNADGSAKKMADTQLDNLAGDLKILQSAISEAKISISDKLSPTLRKFAQRATQWVNRLTKAFNKNGFSGAVKEAGKIVKEFITDSLGIGSDSSWYDIGKAAANKLKTGLVNAINKGKVKLANMLGLTDSNGDPVDDPSDVSWSNIATAAVTNIKSKMKVAAGNAKIKLANVLGLTDDNGNPISSPTDTTWGAIAKYAYNKIKDKFIEESGRAKVKLANWLGMTDDSGNAIDDPSDTTWGNVARKAFDKIKEKFSDVVGSAKVKLANWLGLTDESGNAVDDASDTSWGAIGNSIFGKLKTGFTDAVSSSKIKLANWLGLTDDAGNAVDDSSDTSWDKIAEKMKEKLKGGFDKLKVKLSELLGINADDVGGEVEWADIGRSIIEKLTSYFSHKGDFLKKLILGDEFNEKSTWTDVGKKISGWLTEAFSDGGLFNAILGNGAEKMAAIITFAGDLLTGIANWMSTNSGELTTMLVSLVTALANALSQAAGPIITALGEILGNPELWKAIVEGLANIGEALLDAILGKDITNWIRRQMGVQIPGEVTDNNIDTIKTGWIGMMDKFMDDPSAEGQLAAEWNDFMRGIFHESKIDPSLYNEFMDQFDFDNMLKAFQSMNLTDFYTSLDASLRSVAEGTGKIKKLRKEANDTAGDYTITFHIEQDGEIPDIPKHTHTPDNQGSLPGYAKGLSAVPYDDYVARLHRGEMVLTASQARRYRDAGGVDMSDLENRIIAAICAGMSNATVPVYLNGKDITDEVNRNNMRSVKGRRYSP